MPAYKPLSRILVIVSCCFALTLGGGRVGAARDLSKQSTELTKRTAKTSEDVDKYVAQLSKTEQALALVSQAQGKDFKKRFEPFSKDVNNLEEAQKRVTSDATQMKTAGTEYFSAWDTSIAQISDPDLRQASAERRSKVMKERDDLGATMDGLESELQPFMSNLRDLKAFMEADPTPEILGKASAMIQKSQSDALALKSKIADVQTTLKQFVNETPK